MAGFSYSACVAQKMPRKKKIIKYALTNSPYPFLVFALDGY